MRIAVVGNDGQFEEFTQKFGELHECIQHTDHEFVENEENYEAVFDFSISDSPENYSYYQGYEGLLFLNTIQTTLTELSVFYEIDQTHTFGFNGMSTFVNRSLLELTAFDDSDQKLLESLQTEYKIVDDRVGMVTPRIVCMIINEAFYTVQEGTANKQDIDLGMKLGTNYPMGPFEWLEKMGIDQVYELLEALYEDTKEERYKICPALKKEYLKYQATLQ